MKKCLIIYGGPGSEHEVSVKSAENIFKNIDYDKIELEKIFLKENGVWVINRLDCDLEEGIAYIKKQNFYKVFPVMHGEYGEGGYLQDVFEKNNINFVGTGSAAARNVIDKDITNKILSQNNILIPKSKIITAADVGHDFNYPLILKPVNEGSSIDLYKIKNAEEYKSIADNIFKKYDKMLLQEFVKGREFTCGVIDYENKLISLRPTEIILTKTDTFNYEAKYNKDFCLEVCPADIDTDLETRIQNLAKECHKVLNCRDLSRTDLIIDDKNNLYVLEINTMPGFTENSFIPKQIVASGYEVKLFINNLFK